MSYVWIAGASIFALVMILQYPLSASFPLGGDATRYILKLFEVKNFAAAGDWLAAGKALLTNTWYPGAQVILSISSLLPLSWPTRLIWLVVLAHLFIAGSLGLLLYRLAGWRAAAVAMAIWSLATVTITTDLENGTIAQLWSMGFVILALHQITRSSWWGFIAMSVAAGFAHPFGGLVIAATLITALPGLGVTRHTRTPLIIGSLLALLAAAGLARYYPVLAGFAASAEPFPLNDLLQSPFGPFILLAPFGLVLLAQNRQRSPIPVLVVCQFIILSLLLTLNDRLGLNILTFRFQSFGALAVTILAALAVPTILRTAFPSSRWAAAVAVLFLSAAGLNTWHENSRIFRFYESPSRHARLHPDEQAAIAWLNTNLPATATIISTRTNRRTEWIPILTRHQWVGLTEADELWHKPVTELPDYLKSAPYTHAIFLRYREKDSEVFPGGVALFPVVFANKGAVILNLKP